ncbi:MAG: hypothetical protein MUC49_02575 [Raineya sp.]|jgi:hypothetical protein|nr:hypothetical protein [Raineya sp.]
METTIIEKYNNLQKEILSNFAIRWDKSQDDKVFRNDVQKLYGFENTFDWNIMLNSYYIIDDTELAKKSFNEFNLQGPSRHKDIGERYLRLYGLLSSVYQQKIAIDNLMEIFKFSRKKHFQKDLSKNALLILRNKIGAHPSNYKDIQEDSEHKFDVYEISRHDLGFDKIKLLRNQVYFEEYDLNKAIQDFNTTIENILSELTKKIIKKLFRNQGPFFDSYQNINHMKQGDIIKDTIHIQFTDYSEPTH